MSPSSTTLTAPRPRLDTLLPAVLLAAGSVAFIGGGARHPHVNASLGPMGSDEFYRNFVHTILHVPNWEGIHALILAGPVLWALGAAGLVRLLPARAAALGELGRAALLLGAGMWALTFILDGFIAPSLAKEVESGALDTLSRQAAFTAFQVNQKMVGRFGTLSMVLIGAAETALALALLLSAAGARRGATLWRAAVGGAGVLVGLWPLVATARGEFVPAPFTSSYWTVTALATAAWFVALATALRPVASRVPVADAPHVAAPSTEPALSGAKGSGQAAATA